MNGRLHKPEIAKLGEDLRCDTPYIPDGSRRILDVGCGMGQTLIDSTLGPDVFACGIDCNHAALKTGKQRLALAEFVCARGEQLPFRDESFDFVVSRVALPYMHIDKVLSEIHRVLQPGGRFWMTLHPVRMVWEHMLASLRSSNLKDVIYRSYVMLNGLLFHTSGKLLNFPLNRRRCESFQTNHAIDRALRDSGFDSIRILRDRFFAVTARRAGSPQ